MLPKFLLLREVHLRLERVWNTMLTRSQRGPPYSPQMLTRSQRGPPYSPHALANARCRDPLCGALEGGDRTFTNTVGAISTT